jgi:hypothetical protein
LQEFESSLNGFAGGETYCTVSPIAKAIMNPQAKAKFNSIASGTIAPLPFYFYSASEVMQFAVIWER